MKDHIYICNACTNWIYNLIEYNEMIMFMILKIYYYYYYCKWNGEFGLVHCVHLYYICQMGGFKQYENFTKFWPNNQIG
jgi:hypothetical protein